VNVRALSLLLALAFAGCTATAQRNAVAMPFTGTWHQRPTGEVNDRPVGFLGIDDHQVVFNLEGMPRGMVAISQNETNAGLRSGRLICADGRILYLAVGDSLTVKETDEGRLLTPSLHLDVQIFAQGAGPGDDPQRVLRLWPSAALAIAALPTKAAGPAREQTTAPTPIPTTAGTIHDQRFQHALSSLHHPFLRALPSTLQMASRDGLSTDEIDSLFRRHTQVVRNDVVRDLDAARRGDATALSRADQHLNDLNRVDRAYQDWLGGR
jgi:hypothetical protein